MWIRERGRLNLSEQSCADSYHRGAGADGFFVVVAHAHGESFEWAGGEILLVDLVEESLEIRKIQKSLRDLGLFTDSHEACESNVSESIFFGF